MKSSRRDAVSRGWTEAAPGFWARGTYRIQRSGRRWRWWIVFSPGPSGTTPTLALALDEVDKRNKADDSAHFWREAALVATAAQGVLP